MNDIASLRKPVTLALTDITVDPDLQPRQRLDEATWEGYLNAIMDGAVFPPVVVFHDGETHWLADGFHRWHAHKAARWNEIVALVAQGSRDDAIRFSLGANGTHGKPREPGDYRRSYVRAVENKFVTPEDTAGVQKLLRCTTVWAFKLTQAARDAADKARDADIAQRKAAGQSVRKIAQETGLPKSTVHDAGVRKVNTLETGQPIEPHPKHPAQVEKSQVVEPLPHPSAPKPKHPAQIEFEDIMSPRGQAWGALLEALRAINKLTSPDVLFADRDRQLDVAISRELPAANARINDIHRRFFDAGNN